MKNRFLYALMSVVLIMISCNLKGETCPSSQSYSCAEPSTSRDCKCCPYDELVAFDLYPNLSAEAKCLPKAKTENRGLMVIGCSKGSIKFDSTRGPGKAFYCDLHA